MVCLVTKNVFVNGVEWSNESLTPQLIFLRLYCDGEFWNGEEILNIQRIPMTFCKQIDQRSLIYPVWFEQSGERDFYSSSALFRHSVTKDFCLSVNLKSNFRIYHTTTTPPPLKTKGIKELSCLPVCPSPCLF